MKIWQIRTMTLLTIQIVYTEMANRPLPILTCLYWKRYNWHLSKHNYYLMACFYVSCLFLSSGNTFLPFGRRPPFHRVSSSILVFVSWTSWWTKTTCSWWWPSTHLFTRCFSTNSCKKNNITTISGVNEWQGLNYPLACCTVIRSI